MMSLFLFWISIFVIVYAYAGFPLLLFFIARYWPRPFKKGSYEPRVSIILSAYNEERFIGDKIQNLLTLDYPPEKLEILIGSDGSSDRTDEIVTSFKDPRIRFFRFVSNRGKPHALNNLVSAARGAILVFTDSRQRFEPQAIRRLAENFFDSTVGCVSGELYFEDTRGSGVAQGMGAYWKYEKFLRKKEAQIGSMLGATGAIYAARASLFPRLPEDILVDDMYIPLAIVAKGYRAVFESEARAYDQASSKGSQEFTRKVRTLAGNFQIMAHFSVLLNPLKSPVAWQFWSHKVLRLMVPYFLLTAAAANFSLVSRHPVYVVFLLTQILFYGLAALEALRLKHFPGLARTPGSLPHMFCLLNIAAVAALWRYLTGLKGVWKKAY